MLFKKKNWNFNQVMIILLILVLIFLVSIPNIEGAIFISGRETTKAINIIPNPLEKINTFYGQMYNKSYAGYDINLVTTEVYANVTNMTLGESNGFSILGDGLKTNIQGIYSVDWQVSFEGSGEYGGSIFKNGIQEIDCYQLGSAGVATHQHFSGSCITKLNVGDIITIMLDDHSNPVNDPTVHVAHLRLIKIGELS